MRTKGSLGVEGGKEKRDRAAEMCQKKSELSGEHWRWCRALCLLPRQERMPVCEGVHLLRYNTVKEFSRFTFVHGQTHMSYKHAHTHK